MLINKIKEDVERMITVGNVSDLQDMSELAFYITIEMCDMYEKRKKTAYNQEICRRSTYLEIKQGTEKVTENMADNVSKLDASKMYDYTDYEVGYKTLYNLLERLKERKIEVQTMNKNAKYVDQGF